MSNSLSADDGRSTAGPEDVDRCVAAFQDALNRGQRPSLDEFLPAESVLALLVELVHVELEFRLKRGEDTQVEEYLARYPRLSDDPAVVADLAIAEYTIRRRRDRAVDWESYLRRFPACRDVLVGRFLDLNVSTGLIRGDPCPDADSADGDVTLAGGASAERAAADYPRVPGYEILAEVGRGSMGVVYKAWQMTLNRTVALKMLHAARRTDAERRARFRTEVEAIVLLQHPNIVQVYDVGEYEGQPFFAMEFLDGSLTEHCRGEPQPSKTAAGQVEVLARAMQAVHAKGIVHRDLKPSNVMRTADGNLKIADFGLARRGPSDLTATGDVLGTPSYMAPEQAAGKIHDIGPATDVYALGAILYELLTGRPPFRGVTLLDTLRQVQDIDPVPPRQMQPRTPRDLETICLKCLHKEAHKRYASAKDLAEDLQLFLNGESVRARRPAWPERVVRWSRRRPAVAVLLAAIVLLVVAIPLALLGHTMQLQEALGRVQTEREKARLAEGVAQLNEAEARVSNFAADLHLAHNLFKTGDVFQLPGLLDPHRREDGPADDLRGFAWWYLQRHRQVPKLGLEAHDGPVRLLHYSPDGRSLITSGGSAGKQVLKVWERTSGRLRFSRPLHSNAYHADLSLAAYAPGGALLAGITKPAVVTLWDAGSGEQRLRLPQNEHAYNIALSPDGRWLAVNGGATSVWDCATGLTQSTPPIPGPWTHLAFAPDGKTLVADADYPSFRSLRWWDSVSGQSQGEASSSGAVSSLAFSPSGVFLLLAYHDRGGEIRDARHRIPLHWSDTIGPCSSLAVSADERTLAVGTPDGQVHLRDIATGRLRGRYRWQATPIVQVAFSPDSRTLAAATAEGQVREMDATVEHFPDQLQTIAVKGPVCWSPDGETVAVAAWGGTVRLFDRRTGTERLVLRCPVQNVRCLAFAPDGRILATSCHGELIVRLWDTMDGRLRASTAHALAEASALAFSPDGRRLASAVGKQVRFWNAATGKTLDTLETEKPIEDVAFTPDGRSLLTAGATLDAWDLGGNEPLPRKPASSGWVNSTVLRLAVTRDGRRVATGQGDGTVRVWRLSADRKLTADGPELLSKEASVTSLGFGPDNRTLLTVCSRLARLSDVSTRGRHQDILIGGLTHGALSPDGRTVAIIEDGGIVRLWDAASWRVRTPSGQALNRVVSLVFSTDGRNLVTAGPIPFILVKNRRWIAPYETAPLRSTTDSLRFWDATTGAEAPSAVPARETMTAPYVVARSPDGRLLAAGAEDGSIALWDWSKGQWLTRLFISDRARLYAESGEVARRFWTNTKPDYTLNGESVRALAFSADGRGLAASGNRGAIRVWDTDGWKERGQWRGTPDGSPWIAFMPDSDGVVGSRGGQVCVWNAQSGEVQATLGTETDTPVLCGEFAPRQDVLALGAKDGVLRLWNLSGGEVKRLPGGHQDRVTALTFAPDGKTLASASWDRTVRLWNMAAHREVATLEGHKGRANAVAFSPDGTVLASGGEVGEFLGEVLLWRR